MLFMDQMSPSEGAPEEFDQTIFAVQRDRSIGPVERLALDFVKGQQRFVSHSHRDFMSKEFCKYGKMWISAYSK